MSNELVPFQGVSATEIMKMIGQSTGGQVNLPKLIINKMPDDDNGNTLPMGSFGVYHSESEGMVYGKPVLFRPFINTYQYKLYDEKLRDYSNKSIIFKNWNEEILDESGGVKCGKVSKKDFDSLSPDKQADQKKIKCVRQMYGTVTFNGKTADGTKVSLDNIPCLWRTSGSSFMLMNDVLEALARQKKFMFNHLIELTTKRESAGSNVYYKPVAKITDKTVEFTQADMDLMKKFRDVIDTENGAVMDKWRKSTSKKPSEADTRLVNTITGDTRALEADFEEVTPELNDEIPF